MSREAGLGGSHGGSKEVGSFPSGTSGKEPASQCMTRRRGGWIPGWGEFPGEGNGNLLQYLAWRILWTEEPGGLQSTGSQGIGQDSVTEHVGTGAGPEFC